MGAPRIRKPLIKSRRRVADEGEEEGSVATGGEEDSLSEGSVISDGDDDADGEGSDVTGSVSSPVEKGNEGLPVTNGHSRPTAELSQSSAQNKNEGQPSTTTNDTNTMINGLDAGVEAEGPELEFDDLALEPASGPEKGTLVAQAGEENPTNAVPKGRREEHEEYKKKRDADPAFVPNRGGFFMHDHRSAAPGQNGFRPFGRGRGRGRGGPGGFTSFGPFQPIGSGPADSPWTHDLHDSLAQPAVPSSSDNTNTSTRANKVEARQQQPPTASSLSAKTEVPNRSFSTSRQLGSVHVRILLGGMDEPIVISAVPMHQYTRLPHHRPPLRRDKPVRVSIPDMPIRYIFPKVERSFIFIPRAMRPNQQGFGRTRGRGSFSGGYGGFGPLSSRRTSAYAGSGYSPSIALSRRSSLGRELSADGMSSSPAVASFPRHGGVGGAVVMEGGKPVVRLPPSSVDPAQPSSSVQQTQDANVTTDPSVGLTTQPVYPLPEKPSFTENRPDSLPMHHPKPERTLQVGDIDSPVTLDFNPPQQQQQQPFHQQVPIQMQPAMYQPDPSQYPHSRHPSHPSQHGTPLQQIPETAVHAQPFQPYPYQQPQGYYPQHFTQPVYYYPQQPGPAPSAAAAAPFIPNQPYFYPLQVPQVQQQQSAAPEDPSVQGQTVPYETGGMVYYYNSADLAQGAETSQHYPPTGYVPPPMGMGGYSTPPISYYPQQQQVYYPPAAPQQ